MRWRHSLTSRLRSLFWRANAEDHLDEEIRFHLERQVEHNVAAGMEPDEARRAARREFGGVAQVQEHCRDAWGVRFLDEIRGDLRHAARSLIQSRGLSAAVVVTLALGIGVNAAIFSLIDAVLLRSLPVQSPDELFVVAVRAGSYPMFQDLEEAVAGEAVLFASDGGSEFEVRFLGESAEALPERVLVEMATGRFFSGLGVRPLLGRVLGPEDNRHRGQHPVAVISHRFWQARFANDPKAVGRDFVLNGTVFTIVGVTPAGFYGVSPGSVPDIWVPMVMQEQIVAGRPRLDSYNSSWINVMGRPNDRVEQAAVEARLNLRFRQVQKRRLQDVRRAEIRESMSRETLHLEPGKGGLSSLRLQYSQPLQILMMVAGLILLIACANVANLLLARATTRTGDAAVRLALGAPRWRLIRQSLIESFLLATTGAIAALVLAALGSRALLTLVSSGSEPVVLDLAMNGRLVLFSIAAAALTAMLFGLAPALRGSRADVRGALGAVGRKATDGKARGSLRSALAVFQLAIAVVLVVCAGLFLRTVTNLAAAEGGFDRENMLMVRMNAGDAGYGLPRGDVPDVEREAAEARLLGLLTRLIARLETLPGVVSVAKSECGFLTGCSSGTTSPLFIDGEPSESSNTGLRYEHVWPGYVHTMGMTLLAGRELSEQDGPGAPPVALINETLARTHFGGTRSAVGKTFRFENDTVGWRVAGVVKDVSHRGPRSEVSPYIYYPHAQNPSDFVALTIRTLVPPATLAEPVRRAIADVEGSLNVQAIATLEQQFDGVIRRELLLARLTGAFGVLALALTCVGLYGLLAYSVARRTNEIGLRMALGAQRRTILAGVLRETLVLVAVGSFAGLAAALAASRLLESQLYEVTPNDPATIAAAAAVVLLVGLLAAGLPARRAARIEPMQALRYD